MRRSVSRGRRGMRDGSVDNALRCDCRSIATSILADLPWRVIEDFSDEGLKKKAQRFVRQYLDTNQRIAK